MASSSTSSAEKEFKYDVFLSFRGEDTRNNFVGHLYGALEAKCIETYKDDEKIEKGKRVNHQLLRSIQESKFYIIVFSKNYASSSWCLDELAEIIECQKMPAHTAFPVFYDVEPTDVRKQSGAVKKAFARHKNKEVARKWIDAMKELADLAGWELKAIASGDESKLIQTIVDDIFNKKYSTNSSTNGKLVGMETRIRDVLSSLDIGTENVRMIGIKGMGGGGKTTLARAVYDQISNHFEGKSFVDNVREVSNASLSGLKKLQKRILKDVTNKQDITFSSVHDGKNMLKDMMCRRKTLVVLDDVDCIEQLEALAGEPNWFKSGSRLIITTRDEQVLLAHRVNFIHDVNLLSSTEAICLFSRYAFQTEIPTRGYEELSRQVVQYAHGLPLTIKVLGSFLCDKKKCEWIDAIKRLKTIPLKATMEKLELSYNSLEEDCREIFLDVACILKGLSKGRATRALESRGFHAINGLRVLEQRSLITFDEYGRLWMHDHLEEMGRNIVRQSHSNEPQRHSRLWVKEEIEYILANKLGTEATKCLTSWSVDLSAEITIKGLAKMKGLRLLDIFTPARCNENSIKRKFDNVGEYLPSSLQYMSWICFPFLSLSNTFHGKDLIQLTIDSSNIVQLWEDGEEKVLHKLRFLQISDSKLRTFDLSLAPNLERLTIDRCDDFIELCIPDDHHSKLEHLSLTDSKLTNLHLGNTPNLKNLILDNCNHLVELQMPNESLKLVYVILSRSKLKTLHLGSTPNLETLLLKGCNDLVELQMPDVSLKLQCFELSHSKLKTLQLGSTPNLEMLILKGCNDFGELKMPNDSLKLRYFELSHSKLKTLHLGGTPNLKKLILNCCYHLVELQMPTESLKLMYVDLSHSKLRILYLGGTPNLEKLILNGCNHLLEIQMPTESLKLVYVDLSHSMLKTLHLGSTPNIETLMLEGCNDLIKLRMPNDNLKLQYFNLSHSNLTAVHLGGTPNLKKLILNGCYHLVELQMPTESLKLVYVDLSHSMLKTLHLGSTPNLETLMLEGCNDLRELKMPDDNLKLQYFNLSHSKLKTLHLGGTPYLEELILKKCRDLVKFQMPSESLKLKHLDLSFSMLTNLHLGATPNLRVLILGSCYKLVKLQMSAEILNLECLDLCYSRLRTLHLGSTPNLKTLKLNGCDELVEFQMPAESLKLEHLDLSFLNLRNLHLRNTPNLKTLELKGCHDAVEFQLSSESLKLEHLDLSYSMFKSIHLGSILNLERLILKGCHSMVLPSEFGHVKSLKELNIQGTGIRRLPQSIFQLKGLRIIGSTKILESCGLTSKIQTSGEESFCYI